MPKYKVELCRTIYDYFEVEVSALDAQAAETIAVDMAEHSDLGDPFDTICDGFDVMRVQEVSDA